jgi:hypothetical protein
MFEGMLLVAVINPALKGGAFGERTTWDASTAQAQLPRGDLEALGSSLLESKLLRCVLRRCSARSCQTLCGGATRRRRFLPALKDGGFRAGDPMNADVAYNRSTCQARR